MVKLLSVLISFLLFYTEAFVTPYSYKDKDNLKLSAVILSDMHTESNSNSRFLKIGYTLEGVYSGGNSPDVIAFAGDNTMNGQGIEWFDFYGLVNRYRKKSNVLVAFGNHDFGNTDDENQYKKLSKRAIDSYNYYCQKSIDSVYYAEDYPDVRFIILGSENNAKNTVQVISGAQIEWLEKQLGECAAEKKPAVVINHNLIYATTGRQSYFGFNLTNNNDRLQKALTDCGTTVVYVCGHSHFGISDGTVYSDGNVTYINLPSAGNDGNYDTDEEHGSHGIGMLLEVYDGRFEITFRNFSKGRNIDGYELTVETE